MVCVINIIMVKKRVVAGVLFSIVVVFAAIGLYFSLNLDSESRITGYATLLKSYTGASNPCAVVPEGIVHWWAAEDKGKDKINPYYSIKLDNDVKYVPGITGRGFGYDGKRVYGLINNLNFAKTYPKSFTIEAWVKPEVLDGYMPIIAAWDDNSKNKRQDASRVLSLIVNYDPNDGNFDGYSTIRFDTSPDGSFYSDNSVEGGAVKVKEWNHVAVTYSYNAAKNVAVSTLYVNGEEVDSKELGHPGLFVNQNTPTYLGYSPEWGGSPKYFWGTLDEISIYNRVLSANEIKSIQNIGYSGKCEI